MTSVAVQAVLALVSVLPPHDPQQRMHDFANILSLESRASFEALCRKVEASTTAQLAIVTVSSLDGKSVDEYANQLFNAWSIGRAGVNNGVLILVAPNEHRVRIEVGYGLEPLLTDRLCGDIEDEFMVPAFREQKWDVGIRGGAERIVEILQKYPEAARGVPGSAPTWIRTKRSDALGAASAGGIFAIVLCFFGYWAKKQRGYSSVLFYAGLAAAIGLVVALAIFYFQSPKSASLHWSSGGAATLLGGATLFNVSRYGRYKPRNCKKCGSRLVLLDEAADDATLTKMQQLEEKIGSVDYDVWSCPACLNSETIRHVENASITECMHCKANTVKPLRTETFRAATEFSTGVSRTYRRCESCGRESITDAVIPRISSSSSSSSSGGGSGGGSSFGGGSSGGGGASRGW